MKGVRPHIRSIALAISIALATSVVLAACVNSGPAADEIVARSREYSELTTSYEARATYYLSPGSDDPTGIEIVEVELPDKLRYMGPERTLRAIAIGERGVQPAKSNPGKWTLARLENPAGLRFLERSWPETFMRMEIVSDDDRTWVVGALGGPASFPDSGAKFARRYELKVRKSDFALVELTRWDRPLTVTDEKGDFIDAVDEGSGPISGMRMVVEFSRYGEDFSIELPPGSDIIVELYRTFPDDGDTLSSLTGEIGFFLSDETAIMELSTKPVVQLIPTGSDATREAGLPGYRKFRPDRAWERNTTYTATLTWGSSESDTETATWSFTTR